MKSIALITSYGWVGISSPLINSALYLSMLDYSVDIYIKQDMYCENLGLNKILIENDNINIKFYKCSELKDVFLKNVDEIQEYTFQEFKYKFLIGFDPEGLIKAGILGDLFRIPYIYFSLEISQKQNKLKELEIFFSKKALFTITQDKQRIEVLSKINKISKDNFRFIWNSSFDDKILIDKQDYFRRKFNIDKNKKIILATGTLLPTMGIELLINSIKKWDKEFVLVLHGWIPSETFELKIMEVISSNNNIFLSTDMLPFEEKYIIFQSVDIGFVYYEPYDLNCEYAAGSSGKLFDFMKVGVPVIANNLPGMMELVENNQIGYIFENDTDLNIVFKKILKEYDYLSTNAHNAFSNYGFKDSFREVFATLLEELYETT